MLETATFSQNIHLSETFQELPTWYPGYQRFFLACIGELQRPKTQVAKWVTFLDLTETGNRAWKASGTQGINLVIGFLKSQNHSKQ